MEFIQKTTIVTGIQLNYSTANAISFFRASVFISGPGDYGAKYSVALFRQMSSHKELRRFGVLRHELYLITNCTRICLSAHRFTQSSDYKG